MTESVAWMLIGFCAVWGVREAWTGWHIHTLYARIKDLEDQRDADARYLDWLEGGAADPHGIRHLIGERGDEYGID